MFNNPHPHSYPAMQHWEEAGNSLLHALTQYLDSSLSLVTQSLAEGMPPKYLAARIDSALESLHSMLDRQMLEARVALARTRNRMLSSIHRLPEEALCEIFTYHIFTFKSPPDPRDINEQRIIAYHQRIHTLLGVCSVWRNAILSRGMFWSMVPMIHSPAIALKSQNAAALSLERSQGRPLHFVAFLPQHTSYFPIDNLSPNGPRFRTINISTGPASIFVMRVLLTQFINSITTAPERLSLSQLSLCHTYEPAHYGRYPLRPDFVMYHDSRFSEPEDYLINRLMRTLSSLRIKGAQFSWSQLVFSHHLTELHLQDIVVGFDSCLLAFVRVLCSATRLRDLKFIGIRTFPDHEILVSRIPLPSLESLLLRDLNFNTLNLLLFAINPGSHRLNLFLNGNSFLRVFPDVNNLPIQVAEIEELCGLLKEVPVYTLLLDGIFDFDDRWLTPSELSDLILSMPGLRSLRLHKWRLDEDLCDALTRPPELDTAFPSLQSLHITHSTLCDVTMCREMIASHSASLDSATLGIEIYEERGNSHSTRCNARDTEFWRWLHETVPHLEVMDPKYVPPEFEEPYWRMWD